MILNWKYDFVISINISLYIIVYFLSLTFVLLIDTRTAFTARLCNGIINQQEQQVLFCSTHTNHCTNLLNDWFYAQLYNVRWQCAVFLWLLCAIVCWSLPLMCSVCDLRYRLKGISSYILNILIGSYWLKISFNNVCWYTALYVCIVCLCVICVAVVCPSLCDLHCYVILFQKVSIQHNIFI